MSELDDIVSHFSGDPQRFTDSEIKQWIKDLMLEIIGVEDSEEDSRCIFIRSDLRKKVNDL